MGLQALFFLIVAILAAQTSSQPVSHIMRAQTGNSQNRQTQTQAQGNQRQWTPQQIQWLRQQYQARLQRQRQFLNRQQFPNQNRQTQTRAPQQMHTPQNRQQSQQNGPQMSAQNQQNRPQTAAQNRPQMAIQNQPNRPQMGAQNRQQNQQQFRQRMQPQRPQGLFGMLSGFVSNAISSFTGGGRNQNSQPNRRPQSPPAQSNSNANSNSNSSSSSNQTRVEVPVTDPMQGRGFCNNRESNLMFQRCARSFGYQHLSQFRQLAREHKCRPDIFDCGQVDTLVQCLNNLPITMVSNMCWHNVREELTGYFGDYNVPCEFADIYAVCNSVVSQDFLTPAERGRGGNRVGGGGGWRQGGSSGGWFGR